MIQMLSEKLSLTTQQQGQVEAILTKYSNQTSSSSTTSSSRKSRKGADLTSTTVQDDSDQIRGRRGAKSGDNSDSSGGPSPSQMAAMDNEIMAILTPEQRKLFAQLKSQKPSGPPPAGR